MEKSENYCEICNKSFYDKSTLKRHYESASVHRTEKSVAFKCEICNKTFSDKSNLTRHVNSKVHEPKVQNNRCELCNKTFSDCGNLYRHLRTAKAHVTDQTI